MIEAIGHCRIWWARWKRARDVGQLEKYKQLERSWIKNDDEQSRMATCQWDLSLECVINDNIQLQYNSMSVSVWLQALCIFAYDEMHQTESFIYAICMAVCVYVHNVAQ